VVEGAGTLRAFADAVCATLDERGVGAAAFVGLSLGGMVAQALALAYPARVRALVLAHAPVKTPAEGQRVWDARLVDAKANGMESQVAGCLARWFTPEFARSAPLTTEWVGAMVRSMSLAGYERAAHAIQGLDHTDALSQISAPTLVVCSDRDSVVPPELGSTIAAAIPRARLAVLPNAAHLGNVEAPVVFTETVGAFLGQA
jgi:pimeloyl-ACP methyl ester carboxylesterase